MPYLLLGIAALVVLYFAASRVEKTSARAAKLSFYGLMILLAIGAVAFAVIIGRYGLAAPAGAFGLWAMRAWLLARQIRGASDKQGGQNQPSPNPQSNVTRAEALEVLGLDETASEAEIEAAYKALIVKNHPDQGGTDWLAARLNEARAVLLDN